MRHSFAVITALALLAAPAARAEETAPKADMSHMDIGATASPSDKAFAESMDKMMKDMAAKPTGNTDKDFVVMMMPHHQGAIDMAKVELHYGKDPMLRKLAADIVKAQEAEIAEMKAWLAKHGK